VATPATESMAAAASRTILARDLGLASSGAGGSDADDKVMGRRLPIGGRGSDEAEGAEGGGADGAAWGGGTGADRRGGGGTEPIRMGGATGGGKDDATRPEPASSAALPGAEDGTLGRDTGGGGGMRDALGEERRAASKAGSEGRDAGGGGGGFTERGALPIITRVGAVVSSGSSRSSGEGWVLGAIESNTSRSELSFAMACPPATRRDLRPGNSLRRYAASGRDIEERCVLLAAFWGWIGGHGQHETGRVPRACPACGRRRNVHGERSRDLHLQVTPPVGDAAGW